MSLEAVETAASEVIELQSKPGTEEVKENLRELKGRVLEYADWLNVTSYDAAQIVGTISPPPHGAAHVERHPIRCVSVGGGPETDCAESQTFQSPYIL